MQAIINTFTSQYAGIAVNCYLVKTKNGFFLVDTGISKKYAELRKDLQRAGCLPGNLKLIILTHGDFDHSGNSAALREQYHAPIALHPGDLENVKTGDMFLNKRVSPLAKIIVSILFTLTRMNDFRAFTPDVLLEDGQDLADYGWQAKVIHLPGHSKGSVGILSAEGNLFCGDQFENTKKPVINGLGDDPIQMQESARKLSQYEVKTVYPGHGKPFLFSELTQR
jgi:hydroxyacylglutathione hydrolase